MENDRLDVRWIQRFSNFQAAIRQLQSGVDLINQRELSLLEKQGLIQAIEFTHELAWNVLKDYFYYQGNFEIKGSRDATKEAFKYNLISNGNIWMQMIETRNLTSHTYDKNIMEDIVSNIVGIFMHELVEFEKTINTLKDDFQNGK
ncbi:MAG: nucleotidyltransferase substrate binding protein [Ignavibacteria bacterium]|nr:nucleotidyltransferase substrate binding protein [Ignavibacteria bacterium]